MRFSLNSAASSRAAIFLSGIGPDPRFCPPLGGGD